MVFNLRGKLNKLLFSAATDKKCGKAIAVRMLLIISRPNFYTITRLIFLDNYLLLFFEFWNPFSKKYEIKEQGFERQNERAKSAVFVKVKFWLLALE